MRKLLLALAAFAGVFFAGAASAAPVLSLSGYTATAGSPEVFTITRVSGAGAASVKFETSDGSGNLAAQAGVDYKGTAITLWWPNGQTRATVSVPTFANPAKNGNLTFGGKITVSTTGKVSSAGATIKSTTPLPQLTVQPATVPENGGSVTVHVIRSGALNQPSSAAYATQDATAISGINYTNTSGNLVFAAGQTGATFSLSVKPDGVVQGDLKLSVLLSGFTNAQLGANGAVTITNTDIATQTCPDGSVIPANQQCPAPIPPSGGFMVLGHATAIQACSALNNGGSIVVGQIYNVLGYGGYSQPGGAKPPVGTKDVVVLSDPKHLGDGAFGLFVDKSCVTVAP